MYIAPEKRDLYVYKAPQEPRIIKREDLEDYRADGWHDTPAPFLKYEDIGLDREKIDEGDVNERIKADQILQQVADISRYLNDVINLDYMKKSQLIDFAALHLEIDLKKSLTKKQMLNKIRSKIGDDC